MRDRTWCKINSVGPLYATGVTQDEKLVYIRVSQCGALIRPLDILSVELEPFENKPGRQHYDFYGWNPTIIGRSMKWVRQLEKQLRKATGLTP